MPAGQAPALQPDEMRKYITAIFASAIVLSASHTVIAQHSHHAHHTEQEQETNHKYTCTMHPEVISDHPGNCPKCGMKLVPVKNQKRPTPNVQRPTPKSERGAHIKHQTSNIPWRCTPPSILLIR